jgi:ABC-type amino acid transport substrate-binding protein
LRRTLCGLLVVVAGLLLPPAVMADGIERLMAQGVLRHLGVPYANFVTGAGDGMDVELMQGFAAWLGVDYRYVRTDWSRVIDELIGERIEAHEDEVQRLGAVPIKGDVIANGMTVIPWRERVVLFGAPTFPTQVWLVSRADAPVTPIRPGPSLVDDIRRTKTILGGRSLLGKLDTCLDPSLYDLAATGAEIALFSGTLNELAPALLNDEAELTLLDVPDALVALEKWPGRLKIIGPISERQDMAPAFRPEDADLRDAFNRYLEERRADGSFDRLVLKYYPFVVDYFPDFVSPQP